MGVGWERMTKASWHVEQMSGPFALLTVTHSLTDARDPKAAAAKRRDGSSCSPFTYSLCPQGSSAILVLRWLMRIVRACPCAHV